MYHTLFFLSTGIAPSILVHSSNISLSTNSTVTLVCIAFGAPSPSIVWSRNGSDLSTNNPHFLVKEKMLARKGLSLAVSILHICGFSLLFEDMYTCTAENYAGMESSDAHLFLEGMLLDSLGISSVLQA